MAGIVIDLARNIGDMEHVSSGGGAEEGRLIGIGQYADVCELSGHVVHDSDVLNLSDQFSVSRAVWSGDDGKSYIFYGDDKKVPEQFELTYDRIRHYQADFNVRRSVRVRVMDVGIEGIGNFPLPLIDGENYPLDANDFQRALYMTPEIFTPDLTARLNGYRINSIRERVVALCSACVARAFRPSVRGAFHHSLAYDEEARDRFLTNPDHSNLRVGDETSVLRLAVENVLATKKSLMEDASAAPELREVRKLLRRS